MAAPTYSGGAAGNGRASASLAAGASAPTFDIDVTTLFEARLQVGCTGGAAVAATSGLQVIINELVGSTPVPDTVASPGSMTIAVAASTNSAATIRLTTGRWRVTLKNLDATNPLSSVYATYDTTPTIA